MNCNTKQNNLRAATLFGRDVDDLFSQVVSALDPRTVAAMNGDKVFQPRTDIAETETGYELTLELPGISVDQINVEYHDGVLSISGERMLETNQEGKKFHRVERVHGTFARKFRLNDIDAERLQAQFKDGLLHIVAPKLEESKPRKIEIQVN